MTRAMLLTAAAFVLIGPAAVALSADAYSAAARAICFHRWSR